MSDYALIRGAAVAGAGDVVVVAVGAVADSTHSKVGPAMMHRLPPAAIVLALWLWAGCQPTVSTEFNVADFIAQVKAGNVERVSLGRRFGDVTLKEPLAGKIGLQHRFALPEQEADHHALLELLQETKTPFELREGAQRE